MPTRVALALPMVFVASSCAATSRVGPQFRAIHGKPAMEAQGTVGGGLGLADDGEQFTIPVAVSVGGETARPHAEGALETGFELASAKANGFGLRGGGRVGVGLFGFPGTYLGLRLGPTYTFGEIEGDEWTPTLTLEGLAAGGIGGRVS